MKTNKIYLAYGSNLNLEQMTYRCPYATVLGVSELVDYRLLFRGGKGSAVATVEPCDGSSVPVLLWEITPRDEEALDRYEGFPNLYRKETIEVKLGGNPVSAMVYIMNEKYPVSIPGKRYYDTIVEGYTSSGLDIAVLDEAVSFSSGSSIQSEPEVVPKNCTVCGGAMVWENPYIPGHFHESSRNIEDWSICHECMVEHCCATNCLGCGYGKYPDCQFLEMKRHYMSGD